MARNTAADTRIRFVNQFFEANPDLENQPEPLESGGPRLGNVGRMLARAAQTNDLSAYSLILQSYLINNRVPVPKGVFKSDLRIGRSGRPKDSAIEEEELWVWLTYNRLARTLGRKPEFMEVAYEVYPEKRKGQAEMACRAEGIAQKRYRRFEQRLSKADPAIREKLECFAIWLSWFQTDETST